MADIELVIKIPKEAYEQIIEAGEMDYLEIITAIENGIPLPKGHGRLLDEKDILDIEKNEGLMYDLVDMPDYIADVSAIIEADKAESEDKHMSDVELVIKIPKEAYEQIIEAGEMDYLEIITAIENGTPLPKGHGRLIDADELKRIIQGNDVLNMTGFNVRICDINATPTIIEADKAESEGEE